MSRWHDSVIRTRMPAWWFRIGIIRYRWQTKRAIRKIKRLYEKAGV